MITSNYGGMKSFNILFFFVQQRFIRFGRCGLVCESIRLMTYFFSVTQFKQKVISLDVCSNTSNRIVQTLWNRANNKSNNQYFEWFQASTVRNNCLLCLMCCLTVLLLFSFNTSIYICFSIVLISFPYKIIEYICFLMELICSSLTNYQKQMISLDPCQTSCYLFSGGDSSIDSSFKQNEISYKYGLELLRPFFNCFLNLK